MDGYQIQLPASDKFVTFWQNIDHALNQRLSDLVSDLINADFQHASFSLLLTD